MWTTRGEKGGKGGRRRQKSEPVTLPCLRGDPWHWTSLGFLHLGMAEARCKYYPAPKVSFQSSAPLLYPVIRKPPIFGARAPLSDSFCSNSFTAWMSNLHPPSSSFTSLLHPFPLSSSSSPLSPPLKKKGAFFSRPCTLLDPVKGSVEGGS